MKQKLLIILSFLITATGYAQNPIIQTKYTADPAPLVYNDTVFLYTSHDEDDAFGFKMRDWLLYTSTDMVNWTDHGVIASLKDFKWVSTDNGAWAPQCIQRNGKFYLYCPILQLLYTQNEMLDLIDIGQLIFEHIAPACDNESSNQFIKQAKFLRKRIGNWDDFPSLLHPHEWIDPTAVVRKFFATHTVYEWRTLVQCLLEAALGAMSIGESAASFSVGLDIMELYRLLDAIWVYKIIEGIESPVDLLLEN